MATSRGALTYYADDAEVEGRFFQVYTVKDGKTVRWEEFSDRAEALEAAGLSE